MDLLLGNPAKAKRVLGWDPQQTTLEQLCNEMVDADIAMQARSAATHAAVRGDLLLLATEVAQETSRARSCIDTKGLHGIGAIDCGVTVVSKRAVWQAGQGSASGVTVDILAPDRLSVLAMSSLTLIVVQRRRTPPRTSVSRCAAPLISSTLAGMCGGHMHAHERGKPALALGGPTRAHMCPHVAP